MENEYGRENERISDSTAHEWKNGRLYENNELNKANKKMVYGRNERMNGRSVASRSKGKERIVVQGRIGQQLFIMPAVQLVVPTP